jgi:hypothetical protein
LFTGRPGLKGLTGKEPVVLICNGDFGLSLKYIIPQKYNFMKNTNYIRMAMFIRYI